MNRTWLLKISVDCLMTLTLLFLMAHSLVGEGAHELAGSGMFVLFIVHNLLNANWSKNVLNGRYNPYRIFQTFLIVLIFLAMLSLMCSGIVLSKHVYTFLGISGLTAVARTLHLLASYWGFVLMSFHLGLHVNRILAAASRRYSQKFLPHVAVIIIRLVAFLCAAYGCYAFFNRSIVSYMLYQTQFAFFNFEEPLILFFADYVAVMWFFVFLAHYAAKRLKKAGKKPQCFLSIKTAAK